MPGVRVSLPLLALLLAGCTPVRPALSPPPPVAPAAPEPAVKPNGTVILAAAQGQSPPPGDGASPRPDRTTVGAGDPLAGLGELSAEAVVRGVLARNPTLAQMVAAWQAASARYPQVTSLDDPAFGATAAPGAFGSDTVRDGYRLEVAQKLPYPGKRALRGENALAEAQAAGADVEDVRLQLAESAGEAFYDYYLATRALEVNREGLELLREFRQNAEARYRTGLAPQQDILQADVEIGRQRERQLTLGRMREVAVARVNTLMHLPPDAPLPPPAPDVPRAPDLPETAELRREAFARRPDLRALADRVAAGQAAVALAEREYKPDVEVMGAYDAFWQERPLRAQVGLRVNLPVRLSRREAAVAEARARLAQRQAELARQTDRVNFEVQEAAARVRESDRIVRLYQGEILAAARQNVKSAQSAYTTAKVPFLSLVEAQRAVVNLQDRYYEALADYGRRLATLDRVVGRLTGTPATPAAELPLPSPADGPKPAGESRPSPPAARILPAVVRPAGD